MSKRSSFNSAASDSAAARQQENKHVPKTFSIAALRKAAVDCHACPLYRRATQTVFGAGPKHAQLFLVGEQPGDQEDRQGLPFVGPAGQLLDELLAEAEVDRSQVYVTNAVKHFKWTASGKRRLHAKPSAREVAACHPWLAAEIAAVRPAAIVCLGATAAQSLLGRAFRVTTERGKIYSYSSEEPASDDTSPRWIVGTYHPSAVLRSPDRERRKQMREELASDLANIARRAAKVS
jgi:DNA polymerase